MSPFLINGFEFKFKNYQNSTLFRNHMYEHDICVEFQRHPLKFHKKHLTHTARWKGLSNIFSV